MTKTPVRRFVPPPIVMASTAGPSAGGGSGFLRFVVPTPDSRVGTRVSVLVRPPPDYWDNNTYNLWGDRSTARILFANLWLAAAVYDEGAWNPVTNLLGQRSAPASIPDQTGGFPPLGGSSVTGQLGYSQSIVSDCDAVIGQLYFGQNALAGGDYGPAALKMVLSCRYNALVPMCDDEWADILTKCVPTLLGSPLVIT